MFRMSEIAFRKRCKIQLKRSTFWSFWSKSAPFTLENTMFSERDFGPAQYQVFPRRELRKWKVKIAFWKHCVSQCKWSTFWPKWPKSAPFVLDFATFSEREFRFAQYQVFPLEKLRKWKVKIAFRKHCVFQRKWSTFWSKSQKSDPFVLEFTTFSERDFRLPKYQVFPPGNLRKWKVKIAFWKRYVFQWKWSTILTFGPKSAPFTLQNTMFSERDFDFPFS